MSAPRAEPEDYEERYQELFMDAEDDADEDDDEFEPGDSDDEALDDGLMGAIFEEDEEFHGTYTICIPCILGVSNTSQMQRMAAMSNLQSRSKTMPRLLVEMARQNKPPRHNRESAYSAIRGSPSPRASC